MARITTALFIGVTLILFLSGCKNPIIPGDDPDEVEDDGYSLGDFELRDVGPAGGLIFYIDEADEFEWTFLEAAPDDASSQYHFGPKVKNFSTGTAVGTGKANTDMIVTYYDDNSISGKGAQYCAALTTNGYSDWFLPSRDELEKLIVELYQYNNNSNPGGLKSGLYWCSSDSGKDYAYALKPNGSGNPWISIKNYNYDVRAVRSF